MIISEKQIMQLITIAHCSKERLCDDGLYDLARNIAALLDTISQQQSEELKVIE